MTSAGSGIYYDSSTVGLEYNAGTETLNVGGDVIAYYTSDRRLKDNIQPIGSALEKVSKLQGYTFEWNELSQKEGKEVGVIAQEIEVDFPELVALRDNGFKAVRYDKLVAVLIQAVNELKAEVDELKSRK